MGLFDRIVSLFEDKSQDIEPGSPSQNKDNALKIAACAVFLEIAHSDDEFSEPERLMIRTILRDRFGVSQDKMDELFQIADEHRKSAIDLWQFTNSINRHLNRPERIELMENIWQIVFADGRLDGHEDHIAHRFARLLRLQHRDMIDAKIRARRSMDEQSPPPDPHQGP